MYPTHTTQARQTQSAIGSASGPGAVGFANQTEPAAPIPGAFMRLDAQQGATLHQAQRLLERLDLAGVLCGAVPNGAGVDALKPGPTSPMEAAIDDQVSGSRAIEAVLNEIQNRLQL